MDNKERENIKDRIEQLMMARSSNIEAEINEVTKLLKKLMEDTKDGNRQ